MLIFLDETFRELDRGGEKHKFGAMCGVAIPIGDYTKIANAIYKLKLQHLGKDYADNSELKGKDLLSRYSFKQHEMRPEGSTNIKLIESILKFLKKSKITVFGCVCFGQAMQSFSCKDTGVLDATFKSLCERINIYMKREHYGRKAIIIIDNRDDGTNGRNAAAITNFLVKSAPGSQMRSSILEIPMFAISQAKNIGIQIADIVTTIIGLRVAEFSPIMPLYSQLEDCFYSWKDNSGIIHNTLRWIGGPVKKQHSGVRKQTSSGVTRISYPPRKRV